MTLIAMIIVTGCTIAGSLLWRKRRIVSLMLFIPLLTVLLTVLVFGGYNMYQSWYHTTPDSLQLSVRKENEMYVVEGSWILMLKDKERLQRNILKRNGRIVQDNRSSRLRI